MPGLERGSVNLIEALQLDEASRSTHNVCNFLSRCVCLKNNSTSETCNRSGLRIPALGPSSRVRCFYALEIIASSNLLELSREASA
jgi:hypothetical protein